jgi:hypothetical protein
MLGIAIQEVRDEMTITDFPSTLINDQLQREVVHTAGYKDPHPCLSVSKSIFLSSYNIQG